MKFCDVKLKGDAFAVYIPNTKTYHPRRFHIHEKFTPIIQEYINLRPPNCTSDRFFLNFQKEKCTHQAIGKNKFMKMPKLIAQFLELPNAEKYTGHAFRRTSATLLAESGADMSAIQRHGGWKSAQVAQGYVDESDVLKNLTAQQISKDIYLSTTATTEKMPNVTADAPQKTDCNPDIQKFNPMSNSEKHYHFHNCNIYFQQH